MKRTALKVCPGCQSLIRKSSFFDYCRGCKFVVVDGKILKRKAFQKTRGTYCIRDRIKCKYYEDWGKYPDFFCICVGYKAEEEKDFRLLQASNSTLPGTLNVEKIEP